MNKSFKKYGKTNVRFGIFGHWLLFIGHSRLRRGGFTLIEAIIAVAIIALLSVLGGYNLVGFQKDTKLNSFASQFSSTLESAKNKSINAEIPNGYVLSDFEENSLPHWEVDISLNKYSLYPAFKLADGTPATGNSEDVQIIPGNSITPVTTVSFERLSGKTTPICFNVAVSGYSKQSEVYVDARGNVTGDCP